jgi:hypothetical protein
MKKAIAVAASAVAVITVIDAAGCATGGTTTVKETLAVTTS